MYFSGLPYHLVQRGNNREVCFVEPENYQEVTGSGLAFCLSVYFLGDCEGPILQRFKRPEKVVQARLCVVISHLQ
jgi:hypothetical protein